MAKRFVAYILFGLVAMNTLTLPLILVGFRPLWESIGMPPNVVKIASVSVIVSTLTIGLIVFCVGLYILIKSRKEPNRKHSIENIQERWEAQQKKKDGGDEQ